MKKFVLSLLLFFASVFLYAQDTGWEKTLDQIEYNVLELQNSNEQLQISNASLKLQLGLVKIDANELLTIAKQQNDLLHQWENNWNTTQEILTTQSNLLDNYEFKLNCYRIVTPILVVVITALLWENK